MATVQLVRFVRQLRSALARPDLTGLTDAELWQRYLRERNDDAFETLVRRHAPMVMGVCRRVLRNEQDAEDAFQATFLVLVRRGALRRSPMTIANWLHGVAYRTALEARRAAAKRRAKEAAVIPRMMTPSDPYGELWPVLDEELGRLAERYRAAIVLCDLEGRTRKEVARLLGWAEGTVASRLARGRNILANRLTRRGYAGAPVAGAFAEGVSFARVPFQLVNSTARSRDSGAGVLPCLSGPPGPLLPDVRQRLFRHRRRRTEEKNLVRTGAGERRVDFTHDLDFGTTLALTHATGPSACRSASKMSCPKTSGRKSSPRCVSTTWHSPPARWL